MHRVLTVGVLALQGAFVEHLKLLRRAAHEIRQESDGEWRFTEVRTPTELAKCDALIIPGGESTTMALVASRSGLLEPLRDFVKVERKPTWGTCAGLILLAEAANRTKKGGQDLIGGLQVRVNRNHFGRQTESFEADLNLDFLTDADGQSGPFHGIFIRAPVVEEVALEEEERQMLEQQTETTITAPQASNGLSTTQPSVEILGRVRKSHRPANPQGDQPDTSQGDIVAVKQGHVFGTSFHPELTNDARIHVWWLRQVLDTANHT